MKVIVFGGSGFLGSHVADTLTKAGHDVLIFDRKASPYLRKSQRMIVGDILDQKKVEDSIKGCKVVYNFAGMADIDEASQKPLEAIKYNILGNAFILEGCRRNKVKRFVFASSLYVYSKAGSFYRTTKQSSELLIQDYFDAYGLQYTILRYGSLYGPRAGKTNFIHDILKQAITKNTIVREGDGEELREYVHVLDAAKGSVEILAEEFINQHVIISGHQQMKIKDLLVMIKEMFDNKISVKYLPSQKDSHYEMTPYTFRPKLAEKLISRTYVDIGQGILEYLHELHEEEKK